MIAVVLAYCVFICCMFAKLRIVIRVLETAADFVTEVWSVLFVPPVMMVMFLVWFVVAIYIFLYIFAMGTIEQAPADADE